MNVFLREARWLARSVLIWGAALSLTVVFYMALYPSFSQDAALMAAMMRSVPKPVLDAVGVTPETFTTALGFYVFSMTNIAVAAAVQGMNTGMGIVAKEFSIPTADFLLTKPVSRASVLTAKLLAAIAALAATSLAVILVSGVMVRAVSPAAFRMGLFIRAALPVFFVQAVFASVGFLLAAALPRIRATLPLSLSLVFLFFVISLIQGALGRPEIRYFTPFEYFDGQAILRTGRYEAGFAALAAAVTAACLAGGYAAFVNRDVRAA